METGSELSKTVAIFIVQKILLDETGLTYICHTYERFYAVGTVLSNMVNQLVETQAVRLLKHVVRCYLRLSDNLRCVLDIVFVTESRPDGSLGRARLSGLAYQSRFATTRSTRCSRYFPPNPSPTYAHSSLRATWSRRGV